MNASVTNAVWAEQALLAGGWEQNVLISVDLQGNITRTAVNQRPPAKDCTHLEGTLIPGITNLHSHAHQRAMAGLAEKATPGGENRDSFWSWRRAMYHYLEKIEADDIRAIAAMVYLEMVKCGYTGVAEFQYLHHDPQGKPYENKAELSLQCLQAATDIGIAFTALPVLYQYGGFGSAHAAPAQKRFLNDADGFLRIVESLRKAIQLSDNTSLGIAPHSLRAVDEALLQDVLDQLPDADVVHIHAAEQHKEIEQCLQWSGQRPVEWLLNHFNLNEKWCLIHATHMNVWETAQLARSGAVAGLCPTTEANLGDGIFNTQQFFSLDGNWGIGSDSHISISPVEELRWLEYAQRLISKRRNILNSNDMPSTGTYLYRQACHGGALATGRLTGRIQAGYRADFVVIDTLHPRLYARSQNDLMDSWIFSGNDNPVTDVFIGGTRVITDGQHGDEQRIRTAFQATIDRLAG